MTRYLTPVEKNAILERWYHTLNGQERCHRSECFSPMGDRGYPDAGIIGLCNRLNKLPGLCTIQSCVGHLHDSGSGIATPGHLWLRLDQATSQVFQRTAFLLAMQPLIEQVSTMYTAWGEEIVVILFHGAERDHLEESMGVLETFWTNFKSWEATP